MSHFFQDWHKRCFTCSVCNRHLDSTTVNDGPDGDIYCRTCYASKFGIKGYGFGQGAGTLMSVSNEVTVLPTKKKLLELQILLHFINFVYL